jgi:hypothetical protein
MSEKATPSYPQQPYPPTAYPQQPYPPTAYPQQPYAPPAGQPYPQPGYAPAPGTYPQVGQVMMAPVVGSEPMTMTCPNCRNQIITTTSNECGACAIITCFVCWPLALCPCVQDVKHQCPSCNAYLGTYKRM